MILSRRMVKMRRWWMVVLWLCLSSLEQVSPLAAQTALSDKGLRSLTQALEYVDAYYVTAFNAQKLALASLEGLTDFEPQFQMRPQGALLRLTYFHQAVASMPMARPTHLKGWQKIMKQVILTAREVSPRIAIQTEEVLIRHLMQGLLAPLDRFSRYADPDQAENQQAGRAGFGGIGVRLEVLPEKIRLIRVLPGSPAADAGLKTGDLILKIAAQDAKGLTQSEAVHLLRGRIGTAVDLKVKRAGIARIMTLSVRRQHIVLPTVSWSYKDNVALIRLTGFNAKTEMSMKQALYSIEKRHKADLKGIILDLQGNPGGLLDQAVKIANLFLPANKVLLRAKGRHKHSQQLYKTSDETYNQKIPLIVLINGGSASSSEILAAALQETRRAVVMGTTSYGKGTVQTVRQLANRGELTLTWSRLYGPSGKTFNKIGILPQICITEGDLPLPPYQSAPLKQAAILFDRRLHRPQTMAEIQKNPDYYRDICPWVEYDGRQLQDIAAAYLRRGYLIRQILSASLAATPNR